MTEQTGSGRQLNRLAGLSGARRATGLTVVIDVFRAFSLVPWALARGARHVIPVATAAEALTMRQRHPDYLIAGERDGRPLAGFDFGNSPAAIRRADLSGRVLVHRTSAGTQGLLAASGADGLVTGSFLNVSATARYLRDHGNDVISLVAMGWNGTEAALEDDLCAGCLAMLLAGQQPDFAAVRMRLRDDPTGRRFFDPALPWFPPDDFDACLDVDRFDFVVVAVADPAHGMRLVRHAPVPAL